MMYLNDGYESFTASEAHCCNSGIVQSVVADVDGDMDMDIAWDAYWENAVLWTENDGEAESFTPHLVTTSVQRPYATVQVVDLDGDDDMDIVEASSEADQVFW